MSDLPDLESVDLRLAQEQARCAQQYDVARDEMAAQHGAAESRRTRARQALGRLRPHLQHLVEGQPAPPGTLEAAERLMEQAGDATSAGRQAATAMMPPHQQALGQAVGTPAHPPQSDLPED